MIKFDRHVAFTISRTGLQSVAGNIKIAPLNPNCLTLICDLDLFSKSLLTDRVSYRVVNLFQTSLARPFVPLQANPAELLSGFAPSGLALAP